MSAERQTVAGAYMKMAAHEELCAERYRGINEKLSWVLRSLVGMLLALLAWALVQLYALEPLRRGTALENGGSVKSRDAARLIETGDLGKSLTHKLIPHQADPRRPACGTVRRARAWES